MKKAFKLKAIYRIAGIVALAAIIGFSMAACGDEGGPAAGGGGGGGSGGAGRLTINGIPDSNTIMRVYPGSTDLSSSAAYRRADNENKVVATCHRDGKASSGSSSTYDLYRVRDGWPTGERFTDSGSYKVAITSYGYDSSSGSNNTLLDYVATVNLTNGSATIPWSSFRKIEN